MEAWKKENCVEVVGDYPDSIQYRWNFVSKIPIRKIIQHKQTNKQAKRKTTKTLYGMKLNVILMLTLMLISSLCIDLH